MDQSIQVVTTVFFFALSELLGALCFTVQHSSTRWLVFLTLLFVIYLQLYHTGLELSSPTAQYGIGCRLGGIICIVSEVLIKGPKVVTESRWLGNKMMASKDGLVNGDVATGDVSKGEKLDIENASFFKRFLWATSLYLNPRGSGWAHENRSVLPPRPLSWSTKKGFIRSQGLHILILYATQTANIFLIRRNPYFLGIPVPKRAPVIVQAAWYIHQAIGAGLLAATGTVLNLLLNSIIAVSLGISEIASWRPYFDYAAISKAYTVRNFWGKTWHQIFRRSFGVIGDALADAAGLPKRSKSRTYLVISVAFVLSTALHSVGDFLLAGRSWKGTKAWTFFLPQMAAIWFEDIVISLGRKMGVRRNRFVTILGYVWVVLWFALVSGPMTKLQAAKDGYFASIMKMSL